LKVYVVVGMMGGLIEDIEAFLNPRNADEYEKKLCEEYKIPYDEKEREKYYEKFEVENEVYHLRIRSQRGLKAPEELVRSQRNRIFLVGLLAL